MVSGVGRWPNTGQWVMRLASQGSSGKCCLTPKKNCQDMMVPLLPLDVTQSQMSRVAAAILTSLMVHNAEVAQAERKMKLGPWWHVNVLLLKPVWVGFLLLASREQAVIDVVLCLECLLKANVKQTWKFKLLRLVAIKVDIPASISTRGGGWGERQKFAHPYFCRASTHSRSEID